MSTKVKSKKGKRMKGNKKDKTILQKILFIPKLILAIIAAVIITFGYYTFYEFLYKIVIEPIYQFTKKNYKLVIVLVLFSLIIFNTTYMFILNNKNKQDLEAYNNKLLEVLDNTQQELQSTKEQLEQLQEEYKNKQEETKSQIDSLNKKVTSRSSTERTSTTKATGSVAEYQAYAKDLCINTYSWTENDFNCLVKLWNRESNWNPLAKNSSSGAYGICQSLPASKMASEGDDYLTNYKTQIRWGLKYIKNRYTNPTIAWNHSQQKGWY